MNPSLGLGLIGLGRHGLRYANHLFEGIPQCHLVGVCRQDVDKGIAFAKQHGLRFYQNYHELIADPDIHAVLVVTPPDQTLPIALEAIRRKKPLLLEKPLACVAIDAQQIVKQAHQAKTPLMVAHTLRYEETIVAFKQQAAAMENWKYLVLTNRLEASPRPQKILHHSHHQGALLEIGIHQLDLVRFLTGQEIKQIYCEMDRETPQSPETRAWISLKTNGDIPCLLDISRQSRTRVTRAEIIGEREQLVADWTSNSIFQIQEGKPLNSRTITPTPTIPRVISDFVNALKHNRPMQISGLDGQRAVEIADACYESAQTGKRVFLNQT